MVLPGHLSELIELALPDQVLLIDLRPPTAFGTSHIHGAANLHAPASFLREAPLETIEAALTDDQSRRAFSLWQTARCIVFYARALESPLECPAAMVLSERFASRGWRGEVYLLKGHYREFSASFGRHVGGARMSEEAREYTQSLRRGHVSKEEVARSEEEYDVWREARKAEDQGAGPYAPVDDEKREAMERQEAELELVFRGKFPGMYAAAKGDKDDFTDAKAQMVEYLDRGLTKMREASHESPATPQRAPGHEKLGEGSRRERRRPSEEYVEVDRERHEAPVGQGEQRGRGGGGLINRVFRRA